MEKFTLEAAQKGKELITRDGRPARYVATLGRSNIQFPVVVEVYNGPTGNDQDLSNNEHWKMENVSTDGAFLPPFEDASDIFIQSL